MRVYPDALIVQTHRAPRTVIASVCSLNEQASRGQSEAFDSETIGRTQLDLWERGLDHFRRARERHDPAQFVDVDYQDFVGDPLGTVEKIYSHFSLPFTEDARDAVGAMHEQSLAAHRRPAHRYSLTDFGLTEAEVDERFEVFERP
jgi:hypothetical protein